MSFSPTSPASTPTFSSTATVAVPVGGEGPLAVRKVLPAPNPNADFIWIELAGPASRTRVLVYSVSLARVAELEGPGAPGPGWVRLDARSLRLPNGTFYLSAYAEQGGTRSKRAVPAKLVVLK